MVLPMSLVSWEVFIPKLLLLATVSQEPRMMMSIQDRVLDYYVSNTSPSDERAHRVVRVFF